MDLTKIIIVAGASLILGVLGGFAARSIVAGIILTVLVFVGWFLWLLYKDQKPEDTPTKETDK